MPLDRALIDRSVDAIRSELVELARRIHAEPELGYQEHRACSFITQLVERATDVRVESNLANLPTAFRASFGGGGKRIAILAEYDALPEIGHACGHNLIAGGAVGAFIALARHANLIDGSVELIGTPAEEGGGGKIRLLEAGVFEGVDAAMMYHPFDRDILAHPALASQRMELHFTGSPAHAAARPFQGASALTACLETFRLIDSQRIHFLDGVRVHGIVTNGGQAVNIIVEHAACTFSVRAPSSEELERVSAILQRCARGAALACGVEVAIDVAPGYRDMQNNMTMAHRFGAALQALGRTVHETDKRVGAGSTDMGDVSQYVPSIHPYLAICDEGETLCHERHFMACAASERGFDTMTIAAKALARTACDLLEEPQLLEAAKAEFAGRKSSGGPA